MMAEYIEREALLELIDKAEERFAKYILHSVHDDDKEIPKREEMIADELLSNGVVVLPCKVGNTVYWIENGKTIKSGIAWQFGYESYLWLSISVSKTKVVVIKCSQLYYTKEEAEKALEEMK